MDLTLRAWRPKLSTTPVSYAMFDRAKASIESHLLAMEVSDPFGVLVNAEGSAIGSLGGHADQSSLTAKYKPEKQTLVLLDFPRLLFSSSLDRSSFFPPRKEGRMGRSLSRTIYVGNLPGDTREREVEDLFYKYGQIVDIDLKIPPRPPGYAFVEFEDPRDAEDAIRGRDGYNFDDHRLRVELAHGGQRHSSSVDRYSDYSSSRPGGNGISKHSDYRVRVTGLPSSASWQDLKDHMRRAGDVCFSQVFRDRGGVTGVVDYTNYDDMKYAIRKLDDSLFRNAFARSYIRVREYESSVSRSPSRSPYRSRSRSISRSPSYSSRSYSPEPKYSHRSAYRSRSRSVSSRSRSQSPARSISRSISRSRSPISQPSRRRVSTTPAERSPSRSYSR